MSATSRMCLHLLGGLNLTSVPLRVTVRVIHSCNLDVPASVPQLVLQAIFYFMDVAAAAASCSVPLFKVNWSPYNAH